MGISNCHGNATCTNDDGGFSCLCNEGFVGDGVSCRKLQVDGYLDPIRSKNPTGLNIEIYTKLESGFCSLMGFDWENEASFMAKFKWSTQIVKNRGYLREILEQFSKFGAASIARSGAPQCNDKLAGIVPCVVSYFIWIREIKFFVYVQCIVRFVKFLVHI